MVNPQNGDLVDCSTMGVGWLGAPTALVAREQCITKFKALGYITEEEYKASRGIAVNRNILPADLKIDSSPSGADVWAGPMPDKMKVIGQTPFFLSHPRGGQIWAAECYKATMDGYNQSECVCKRKDSGDRVIFFTLIKKE